uniref:Uncharacterized protein n=1 Tax=Amphimedon queenslandica TaxID=400682 RepID=A0A1X7TP67_AMPQE
LLVYHRLSQQKLMSIYQTVSLRMRGLVISTHPNNKTLMSLLTLTPSLLIVLPMDSSVLLITM